MDEKKEECELVLVHHPESIVQACARCRRVISQGTWAIGLTIGTHKYIVGKNPPTICFGEEKKEVEVFTAESDAHAFLRTVREQLNTDGSTANLKLFEGHRLVSSATH